MIEVAAAKNPEFALDNLKLHMGRDRDVPPVRWCSLLNVIANSTTNVRTKERAIELSEEWLEKCRGYSRPYGEIYVARTLASAGQKEDALKHLDHAESLVTKLDFDDGGASIRKYIENVRKTIH